MKRIIILLLISLLLLSTISYVSSEPITSSNGNDKLNFKYIIIQNKNQDMKINNNDVNSKPIHSRSLANSPWPMFHHDLTHTGLSPYNTSANPGTLLWSFETSGAVSSSSAIGSDGTIYLGSVDSNLYAINPNGTKKWNFLTGSRIESSPAIGSDGTIYVGSGDNNLYAIYPNGIKKWNFTTGLGIKSSPAIGPDGTIYVGSNDANLYAIYPNGIKKWNFTTGGAVDSSPAVGPDGTIYVGSNDYKFYAINPDGTEKWSYNTGNWINSSPAIGSDGTIYVGSFDNNLYAINPNGTINWSFFTGNWVLSSPALGSDGTIYIGSNDDKFYAINPNGTKKWSFATAHNVKSAPAIDSNGTIYVSSGFSLYAINPDGTEKWFFPTGSYVDSSPAIGSDEIIYIGSRDDKLYAIGSRIRLSSAIVNPISGYSDTYFNYSINYLHTLNNPPIYLNVSINENNYTMLETDSTDTNYLDGKDFYLNITHLDIGQNSFRFFTTDGLNQRFTPLINKPVVYNTAPNITTVENLTAIEDTYYEVSYEYEDIDIANGGQVGFWNFSSNASWLTFDNITAILNGTPMNDDVGQYWVNITINDTMDIDITNFTLTVLEINDNPKITTSNVEYTYEDAVYFIDYNATDIDSPLEDQIWSLSTNASSWLDIDSIWGTISGTPINDDVGSYLVNVSVNDTEGGFDFTNFTLIVLDVNDPPEITTNDILTGRVNELYSVDYNAMDIDSPMSKQSWILSTNATWLSIETTSGILSGTPSNDDVGWFNVNVTVNDNNGGLDWHEFLLLVEKGPEIKNEPPKITTEDLLTATVDKLFEVDYDATDVDTPQAQLSWSLETNASWLSIDTNTGLLSGTPELEDVGSYWIKVSVFDGVDGWDNSEFTLYVTTEPITKFEPKLSNPSVTPTSGNTETHFFFSVDYSHPEGDPPDSIQVVIDEIAYDLNYNTSSNSYEHSMKLYVGELTYYFTATLGEYTILTEVTSIIVKRAPIDIQPEDGDGDDDEDNTMLYAGIGIVLIIIIVVLILLFIFLKKKKGKEEPPVEEAQPPPPLEVPPAEPPLEQPPEEVPPEQMPAPETPPPEQPQFPEITLEQPAIPEVIPQAQQPQFEPTPEPAPMPQVEEQPAPQPQVKPQPQGQAPVPKVKTQPTVEENEA